MLFNIFHLWPGTEGTERIWIISLALCEWPECAGLGIGQPSHSGMLGWLGHHQCWAGRGWQLGQGLWWWDPPTICQLPYRLEPSVPCPSAFEHMTLSLWVWEWNCMRSVPSRAVCLWRLCGAGAIVMILEPWKLLYIKFRLLRPAPPLLLSTHIPGWGRTTSISTISCDCVHFISEGLVTSCKHLALISAGWRRIAWQGNSFLHKSGVLISKFRCARVCWNKKVGLQP